MPVNIDELYAGIKHAETGSEKNPYIRTKAKPKDNISTAFGPVQITSALAKGSRRAGYLSKESSDFYDKEMAPRYQKMKQGRDKRYDYGGDAEFDGEKHGPAYETFAKDVMKGVAKEAGDDEGKFIEKWRGVKKSQDPKYWQKIDEGRTAYRGSGMRQQFAAMKGTDQGRPNTEKESELD